MKTMDIDLAYCNNAYKDNLMIVVDREQQTLCTVLVPDPKLVSAVLDKDRNVTFTLPVIGEVSYAHVGKMYDHLSGFSVKGDRMFTNVAWGKMIDIGIVDEGGKLIRLERLTPHENLKTHSMHMTDNGVIAVCADPKTPFMTTIMAAQVENGRLGKFFTIGFFPIDVHVEFSLQTNGDMIVLSGVIHKGSKPVKDKPQDNTPRGNSKFSFNIFSGILNPNMTVDEWSLDHTSQSLHMVTSSSFYEDVATIEFENKSKLMALITPDQRKLNWFLIKPVDEARR